MALLEKETEKLFYPIGEVADMFDKHISDSLLGKGI